MYKCVLWSGKHLPLPPAKFKQFQQSDGWSPLFGSADGVPIFWWLLLSRFNCFWRTCGSPIFIVDRTSALSRAEARLAIMKDALTDHQKQSWAIFSEYLLNSPGELFNLEVSELWKEKFDSNAGYFETHMKNQLVTLDISAASWRKLSLMKKEELCAAIFNPSGNDALGWGGHRIIAAR